MPPGRRRVAAVGAAFFVNIFQALVEALHAIYTKYFVAAAAATTTAAVAVAAFKAVGIAFRTSGGGVGDQHERDNLCLPH